MRRTAPLSCHAAPQPPGDDDALTKLHPNYSHVLRVQATLSSFRFFPGPLNDFLVLRVVCLRFTALPDESLTADSSHSLQVR